MDKSLYGQIHRTKNLYEAWIAVRRNARQSSRAETRQRVAEIDENPIQFISRLQRQLREHRFIFEAQQGIVKRKSNGKSRGIVASPLENRVVQRAILNILQSENIGVRASLGSIPEILECPTSVGGIPKRGVPYALSRIMPTIENGAKFYARSDIKGFFDNVDRSRLFETLRSEISDTYFTEIIVEALKVELANEEEIREELSLFPLGELGVAQGNSLSCLAANVALAAFDKAVNKGKIVTIRYIDDFVVLGPDQESTRCALREGVEVLKSLGLTAYTPQENPQKASEGKIADGFTFIGCDIRSARVVPGKQTRRNLLADIDTTIKNARTTIAKMAVNKSLRRSQECYVQALSKIDRQVRGWGDAYAFCTDRLIFSQVDDAIDQKLLFFRKWFAKKTVKVDARLWRRAYGVALLSDTKKVDIEEQLEEYHVAKNPRKSSQEGS